MKSLYEMAAAEEIKERLNSLGPGSQRIWGKMEAPQMVAHCSAALEMAIGDLVVPQVWIGRVLGRYFKAVYSNDKPWAKGNPTAPSLVVRDLRDLDAERNKLMVRIDRFREGGTAACTREPHCFFGHLTPEEWGNGMYKHIDHHLRQFGA